MRIFLISGILALGIVCCQSKPVSTAANTIAAPLTGYPQTLGATPLLTSGFNRSAVYSPDGTKIYYISLNRRDHRNAQAYEYDLTSRADRRITFQDGEVFSVTGAPAGNIFYASNTDEIKEQPFARELDYRFTRAEIYHSDRYGEQIDRLTESPGFDGEMIYVPARDQLLFTSARSGTAGLYWLEPAQNKVTAFQVSKNIQRAPALSSDGKYLYWVEESADGKTQSIVKSNALGKNRTVVRTLAGVVKNLAVNSSGKVAYAWQPKSAAFQQIDLLTPESNCNRTLLKSAMDFLDPQFSAKNENVLIFRGSLKENSVVYRWELPEALGPCL